MIDPRRFIWMPGDIEILFVPGTQRFIRYPGQPRDEQGQFASDGGGNTQSKGLNPRKSRVFAEKVAGDKQADVVGSESVIARRMADEIGFSGLPRVVSRSEMDAAIAAGATEAYRGLSKGEYAEQLRTGSARYSVGTHGSGIYLLCGPDAAAQAAEYATGERWSMAAVRPPTYLGSGVLVRMALVGDAKIIDYEEAAAERYRAGRVYTDEAKRARASGDDDAFARAFAAGDQVADAGLYAMSKGYDAVRFDVRIHQSGVGDIDYPSLIVLNRTALLIQDEDVPVPKAVNRLVVRYPDQPRDEKGQFASTGVELTKRQGRLLQQCRDTFTVDIFKAVLEVDSAGVADALDLNTVHEKDVEAIARFVHAEAGRTLTERGFPSTMTVWRAGSVLPDSVESFTTHGGGVKQFGAAEPYWVARSDVLFDAEGFLGRMQSYAEDELLIRGSSVSAAKPTTERYPGQPRDELGQFAKDGGGQATGDQHWDWQGSWHHDALSVVRGDHKPFAPPESINAWTGTFTASRYITGEAAALMGIAGYQRGIHVAETDDAFWGEGFHLDEGPLQPVARQMLSAISADRVGSEEPLYHGFQNRSQVEFKPGDTLSLPTTAASGDREFATGYTTPPEWSSIDPVGPPVLFEFPKGTPMAAVTPSTQSNIVNPAFGSEAIWAEASVAGRFRVESVRAEGGLTVVRLRQTEVFDPVTGWKRRGEVSRG